MGSTARSSKRQSGGRKTQKAAKRGRFSRGSRAEVMHGNKDRTSGGLSKCDLAYNKHGRIVSRAKASLARKQKHLAKAGYSATKGKFGYIRIKPTSGKKTRKSKKSRKSRK